MEKHAQNIIIDLVPQEGTQEQESDTVRLTQVHNLVVTKGTQARKSDSPKVGD